MDFIQIWVFGNSWRNIRKTKLLPVKKMLCLPNVDSRLSFSRIPTKKNSNFFILFLYFPQPKKTTIFRVHLKKTTTWPTKYVISFIKKTNFRVSLNE